VSSVDRLRGGFAVTLESGEQVYASSVVVATGLTGSAYVPPELKGLPPDLVSHSSRHRDLSVFAGREVVVLGAGQSALEGAALMREAGASVRVLARRRVRFTAPPDTRLRTAPGSHLGRAWSLYACEHHAELFRLLPEPLRLLLVRRVLGPAGGWWLRDRLDGTVPIIAETVVTGCRAENGRVVLLTAAADGTAGQIRADHVMAATGYRVSVDSLGFLSHDLRGGIARAAGSPRLTGAFESSVPGLYFTGLPAAATFGPLLRFVCGTEFAAPRVGAAVARSLHARRRPGGGVLRRSSATSAR
jgi:cation diffusion facilitator CzcD-associated flavoprotein CzcO